MIFASALAFASLAVLAGVFILVAPNAFPAPEAELEVEAELELEVAGPSATSVAPVAPLETIAPVETVAPAARTVVAAAEARRAQMAFTGDTLAHGAVVRQGAAFASGTDAEYDFAPMFAPISEYVSGADLAICHLETPLSPDNTRISGYPTFNVPREMATGLVAAGYDGCTTASNHSLDQWPQGVIDTLDVLDDAGLGHSGMARDQAEYDDVTLYDANGITVASLSYSYGFNGFREPTDTPWLVNEINIEEIVAEADRARAAGAEIVVLSMHWGNEYRHDPSQYQVDNAAAVIAAADIDLIIGHHAHVVQPVDIIDGVPVVYGLGNIISNQTANCCTDGAPDGVVMLVDVVEEIVNGRSSFTTEISYVPTRVDRSNFTIVPVVDVVAQADAGLIELSNAERDTYIASRERTAEALRLLGDAAEIEEISAPG